jgi:ribosome-associated heat shock protein Hsp15
MRVDKWLWCARFFKTRSLAVEAIETGRVSVNGERAKPAKDLKPGDEVIVRRPPFEMAVVVRGMSERRGPAAEAQQLYEEKPESRAKREALAAELKANPASGDEGPPHQEGSPHLRAVHQVLQRGVSP